MYTASGKNKIIFILLHSAFFFFFSVSKTVIIYVDIDGCFPQTQDQLNIFDLVVLLAIGAVLQRPD